MKAAKYPPGSNRGGSDLFRGQGFGFLRPDDGGRDIFFHVSRLVEGLATDLRPGTRVLYELGMDRTGKMAASSIRIRSSPGITMFDNLSEKLQRVFKNLRGD